MVNIIKKQIEIISKKITELLGIPYEDKPYNREHTKLHRLEVNALNMIFNCVKTIAERLDTLESKNKERENAENNTVEHLLSESEKKMYGLGGKDESKSKWFDEYCSNG